MAPRVFAVPPIFREATIMATNPSTGRNIWRSGGTPVRNPLTLLAVFCGLAEVAASVTLTRLPLSIQQIYVWFVMGFPLCLVFPFFLFLWFRPANLYAPGDYRKDPQHLTPSRVRAPERFQRPKQKKDLRNNVSVQTDQNI